MFVFLLEQLANISCIVPENVSYVLPLLCGRVIQFGIYVIDRFIRIYHKVIVVLSD